MKQIKVHLLVSKKMRSKQCTTKVAYHQSSLAQAFLAENDPSAIVYKCPWCFLFHAGHEPSNIFKAVKKELAAIKRIAKILATLRERSLLPHEREYWNIIVSLFATELGQQMARAFDHDKFVKACGGMYWEIGHGT